MMTLSPVRGRTSTPVTYRAEIEREIAALEQAILLYANRTGSLNTRWLALSMLEGDSSLIEQVWPVAGQAAALVALAHEGAQRILEETGEDVDTLIADQRYRFIAEVVNDTVARPLSADYTVSDKIDQIVTNTWLGIPIFLAMMWVVFQMTANISSIYVDWIDATIAGPVSRWVSFLLGALGLENTWFESLVLDGVIAGAGGVLVFVPVLGFLYFFIAVLEDSGYVARAAFVMDRFMRVLGLHGKSFIPLLVGFGCSVPGIYATRTLDDHRDRVLTALLVPFMSCAARLPVYVLIGTAFFGSNSGNLVFAMYLLGIGVAVVTGLLLRRVLFEHAGNDHFVMEMPAFRRPSLKTVGRQVWERTAGFVSGVGTVIVVAAVIVWFLLNVPYHNGAPPALEASLFGKGSQAIAPVFAPAGFGTWEASGSLVTGMIAKEVVISSLSQVYGVEQDSAPAEEQDTTFGEDLREIVRSFGTATTDTARATVSLLPGVELTEEAGDSENTDLQAALRREFSALQAVAFSVFILLYTPCVATLGAMRQEIGGRWMWFSVIYMLVVAWIGAVLTYQVGGLLGLG